MLKVKSVYDWRAEFSAALRRSKLKQCTGMFSLDAPAHELGSTKVKTACALGLGILSGMFDPRYIYGDADQPGSVLNRIGLRPDDIVEKNDRGWTFGQIADWADAQP